MYTIKAKLAAFYKRKLFLVSGKNQSTQGKIPVIKT